MVREIRKKMLILSNRMPFSDIAQNCFADMEKKEWVTYNMMLEGSALSDSQIDALVCGNCILEATIGDHIMVERLSGLFAAMKANAQNNRPLDLKMISEFRSIYVGDMPSDLPELRRKNLMMPEIDYMAKLPAEIPESMEELGTFLRDKADVAEGSREVFEAAVKIHNSIIEIMPFGEEDKVLARAAMLYFLMVRGYPAVLPKLKETDYNEMIFRCFRLGSAWAFEEKLIEEILTRLEFMIQLTAY